MLTYSQQRTWFPRGYITTLIAEYEITSTQFSALIDSCLTYLTQEIVSEEALINLKGCDQGEGALLPDTPQPSPGELCLLTGTIATKLDTQDSTWEPFCVTTTASFERFEGSSTIIHAHNTHQSKSIPPWFPWRLLGEAAPILPHFFRLALDHYSSKFAWLRLGFMPVVTDSFRLEATESTLKLKLVFETPYKAKINPLVALPVFNSIVSAITQATAIPISNEIASKIRAT